MTPVTKTTRPRLRMVGATVRDDLKAFAEEVRAGLTTFPKYLPCRYFYDRRGSRLFERICRLPEYYLTRAERQILKDHAGGICAAIPEGAAIVELGSGSSVKTRILIKALVAKWAHVHYVPIDVSRKMLKSAASGLMERFADLQITAFAGDYERGLRFVHDNISGDKCFLWLGSSIGNFDRDNATAFLRMVAAAMEGGDRLLVGVDLRKDRAVLERAYDDPAGVTAAFNKNILVRINRELGGNFDVDRFAHRARYDEARGVVEIHLVSQCRQEVSIEAIGLTVPFATGESIHTENSHKYDPGEIDELFGEARFEAQQRWFDRERRFSLTLFAPAG